MNVNKSHHIDYWCYHLVLFSNTQPNAIRQESKNNTTDPNEKIIVVLKLYDWIPVLAVKQIQ